VKQKPRKTDRRRFLKQSAGLGALVGFPAIVRSAGTQRFEKPIVAGNNAKEGDPNYVSMARIPEILKEKYDIEMEFQIHPMSTLGTDVSQLEAVQTGFIDMTSNATAQFSVFSTEFEFVGLPYAITDWDMADRLYKSDLWKEQAASFEKNVPVKVLPPLGSGGFRLLWNNVRPLPAPDAVQGLKFRTTRSPLSIELVKAWGGNPTPLPWTETYNGLKSGIVDGFHVQPIWTYKFNMHEVLKHATEVKALFSVQFQVMNANTFNSMPESMQGPFMEAAQMAADEANALDRSLEDSFKATLVEAGMEIHTPSEAEAAQWRSAGESVWETAGKDIDASVIERMVALR
jgi:TRAP-type C4-dicarboxylate transport system substrate-binding protein